MLLARRALSMVKGAAFSRTPCSISGSLQRAAGAAESAKLGGDPLPGRFHGICGGVAGMSTSSRRAGYEAMKREANSDDAWREAEKKIIATVLEVVLFSTHSSHLSSPLLSLSSLLSPLSLSLSLSPSLPSSVRPSYPSDLPTAYPWIALQ